MFGPDLIRSILEAGYNSISLTTRRYSRLAKLNRARSRRIQAATGLSSCRESTRIPVATLRKLEDFARNAGNLESRRGGGRRSRPAWKAGKSKGRQIHTIVASALFEGSSAPAHFVDDGAPATCNAAGEIARAGCCVFFSPLRYRLRTPQHAPSRKSTSLANTGQPTRAKLKRPFVSRKWSRNGGIPSPQGFYRGRRAVSHSKHSTSVALDLEPYESRVLVDHAPSATWIGKRLDRSRRVLPNRLER